MLEWNGIYILGVTSLPQFLKYYSLKNSCPGGFGPYPSSSCFLNSSAANETTSGPRGPTDACSVWIVDHL